MLILALDTTTSAGSCALMRDASLMAQRAGDPGRPQDARLPGDLAALLEHERVSLADIDAFAVGIGPGSFTGLRVGIATMQGLALATDRPLIGVSALDALARLAGDHAARVATWMDAWRGEVYAALYERGHEAEPPRVEAPERLLQQLAGQTTTFTGDGAALHASLIRDTLGAAAHFTDPASPLLSGAMAALATEAYRSGHRPPPHAIRPLYVRRSDAELARDRAR